MTEELRDRWAKFLWAALLVCLPITSFKYIPLLGAGTVVRPLAIYPLLLLLPLISLRYLKKGARNPFSGGVYLLVLLVLSILISSAIGGITPPVDLGGVNYLDRVVRSLVTLAVGVAFFLSAVEMNRTVEDVKFSVRWLIVGLVLTLFWAMVQFVGLNSGYRGELNKIQNLFSIRGLVKNKRSSGFAFEPSWLAGQLATLYLPWLFATFIHNFKAWKNHFFSKLPVISTITNNIDPLNTLLLAASVVVLFFTYSRSGLAMVLVGVMITYLFTGKTQLLSIWRWFLLGFRREQKKQLDLRKLMLRVVIVIMIIGIITSAGFFLADKGYIAAFAQNNAESIVDYLQNAYLGPRFAYIDAGLSAFEEHPIFGVGFGASGFWVYQNMPDWALAGNPEIASQLSPSTNIFPNPKNLLVRFLAETGILGFSIYLVFLIYMISITLKLIRWQDPEQRSGYNWIGTAGLFGMVTIFLLCFSQDSLAMPEIWILPGILTGIFSNKVN